MEYLYLAFVTLLLAQVTVEGVPTSCQQEYQFLLQDLVALKGNCEDASFADCCQVKELVPLVGTNTYDVGSECNISSFFGLHARCDMETDGGGWMVIQRRIDASVDFYRNWTDYVHGFGDLEGEFWYGLENIHCLTTRDDVELRIELGNEATPSIVWTYQLFRVDGAATNYLLTIGEGQGVGGTYDAMLIHNERQFSTPDKDNDASNYNCAQSYGGGWWYSSCRHSNLNGRYHSSLTWYNGTGNYGGHIKFTNVEMKIRPKRCACTQN